MRIPIKYTLYALLPMLVAAFTFFTTTTPVKADGIMSGAACRAALLDQALLGLRIDKEGITNNADKMLWVICPVAPVIGEGNITRAAAIASFPPSDNEMTCIIRLQAADPGTFDSYSFTITKGVSVAPPRGSGGVTFSARPPMLFPNMTVVCPLDPGEGVEVVGVFN